MTGLFLLSFATWSFATPVMGVPDEPAHTIKAASIWQGDLRGEEEEVDSGNPTIAIPITVDRVRVPESYAALPSSATCFAFNVFVPASCAPPPGSGMRPTEAITSAGSYSPLFYALVGWPTRFVGADRGVPLMRLTSALVAALLMGVGFASLRRLVRADVAFLAVALAATPMTHFLAGSVNPNGIEVVAAIALWCSALSAVAAIVDGGAPARSVVASLVVSGAALALLRPLSPLFVVLIVGTAVVAQGPSGMRRLATRRPTWVLAAALALPVALALGWSLGPGRISSFFGATPPEDRSLATILLGLVDDYVQQAVAVFGWKDTGPVLQAIVPWLVTVVAVTVVAALFGRAWAVGTLLALVAGSVILPVVLQWPTARTQGLAWQGRYQLPVLAGVPLLAAVIADAWARSNRGPSRRLVWGGCLVAGWVLLASHLVVMQRNVVGVDGPVNYLVADPGWLAPWQRWALLAATVVAAVGFPLLGGVALRPTVGGRHGADEAVVSGPARSGDEFPHDRGGLDAHSGDRLEGSARHGTDVLAGGP